MVLNHFKENGDSLKLLAAKFILENATYHYHQRTTLISNSGTEVIFNVYNFNSSSEIEQALDSLKTQKFQLYTYPLWDVDSLRADAIIENIDLAFTAWSSKPWANHISFDQFCEYILPYRAYYEPLENWRLDLTEKYNWVIDSIHNTDPLEACKLINLSLGSWLKFDWNRGNKELNLQGISEMTKNKNGKCSDLVTMTACALRSQGIPVAIDYVPHWAHRNSGHSWNVIFSADGTTFGFNGTEKNPGQDTVIKAFCKVGKIYRHTFNKQSETLAARKEVDDIVPPFFNKFNMKDVTREYISVGDIELKELKVPEGTQYVYLCTYSSGNWKPIHWAEFLDGKATFKEMDDNNIVYLPVYYHNKQISPAGHPFIYYKDHSIVTLKPTDNSFDLHLKFYNKFYDHTLLVGYFKEGIRYTLSYWDGHWKRIETQSANKDLMVTFKKIPDNTLLRIESVALSNIYQRPFIISNGEQIFF